MDEPSRTERIDKQRWEASAHTLEAKSFEARLSQETLDALQSAHAAFQQGGFARALSALGKVPMRHADVHASALAGLSYLGLDRYDDALEATERALELTAQTMARLELNRALVLTVLAHYDDALQAIARARTLAPDLWAVPLGEIVVREHRQGPDDEAQVDTLARTLRERWPEWTTNGIGRFLASDVDYGPLRIAQGGARFTRLFGITPDELAELVQAHDTAREESISCTTH